MMEYRLGITLNHNRIELAYLAFESLVNHSYDFFCFRCGHHPKVLVHDLTKKAVFKFPVNEVKEPINPSPVVNADKFWTNIRKDVFVRGFLKGQPSPYLTKPSYEHWAPYIGPHTRSSEFIFNTEFEKIKKVGPEDHEPVPEEVITHLLADEKLDTVKRFCRVLGVSSAGSKLDMLCRLRSQSVGKAQFDHAYSSLYGHSGGWLSSTCPHNVTYAVKFLLRSESPRDYIDILRSFKHVPTINIADIANGIAKMGNRLVPNFFQPNEGRVASDSSENICAAKSGKLSVSLPYLCDDRPKETTSQLQHPITGSTDKFMLFDWFHQGNCKVDVEFLRRATLVKELAGHVNTQAAEQLHRDKARDVYWLNEMSPTNHIFSFRLVTHLKNSTVNDSTLKRQGKVIPNLRLGSLGQLVRSDGAEQSGAPVHPVRPTIHVTDVVQAPDNRNSDNFQVLGKTYQQRQVRGDGNCLFRAVCVVVPELIEDDHVRIRQECFQWCIVNKQSLDISDDELADIRTPCRAVGEVALNSLVNVLKIGLLVVYKTRSGVEQQLFQPRCVSTGNVAIYPILFDLSGHYDALVSSSLPSVTNRNIIAENSLTRKRKASGNTSEIAKKRRTAPVRFSEKPLLERRRLMLGWLADAEDVRRAMDGDVLEECEIETRPECISSNILDDVVNMDDIRAMLSVDAWESLIATLAVKKRTASWMCPVCHMCLEEGQTSMGCDGCLQWLHLPCAGLIRVSRKSVWFCPSCK